MPLAKGWIHNASHLCQLSAIGTVFLFVNMRQLVVFLGAICLPYRYTSLLKDDFVNTGLFRNRNSDEKATRRTTTFYRVLADVRCFNRHGGSPADGDISASL